MKRLTKKKGLILLWFMLINYAFKHSSDIEVFSPLIQVA